MKRPPADATPTIYLMGMMGSGKSTLGRALARELGRSFVDLDERIEQRAGLSIPEVFQRYGESYFRDLETAALAELCPEHGLVVALGGGTPKRATNREMLRESGCVIHLKARPETLAKRLPDQTDRPLLRHADDPQHALRELLTRREPLYNEIAHIVIDNEDDTPSALDRLIQSLTCQGWIGT